MLDYFIITGGALLVVACGLHLGSSGVWGLIEQGFSFEEIDAIRRWWSRGYHDAE